jgi:glycosyltransferase involved in cell wall biosynthesis
LRVVIASGIFPPDIGGPATHTADLAIELTDRGHYVHVLTLWDGVTRDQNEGVVRFPRRWPLPVRLCSVIFWLVSRRRDYDVIYAVGLLPEAVAGACLARRPVVAKVVGDPAWERATRRNLTRAGFEDFQRAADGGVQVRLMAFLRDWSLRHATKVIAPSRYLQGIVRGWVGDDVQIEVVPNGVRAPAVGDPDRQADDGLRLIFVGRLVSHKRVDVLLGAVFRTEGVRLEIIGEGPERRSLNQLAHELDLGDRVSFAGSLTHKEVMKRLGAADAMVLASEIEGLPHAVIEAFAVGVPVIAPPVGGMGEAVTDGENGLLVDPPTEMNFACAISRLRDDVDLQTKLKQQTIRHADRWRFEYCADGLEAILRASTNRPPRVVFLGKTRYPKPLSADLERKVDLIARYVRPTFIAVGAPGVSNARGTRIVRFPRLFSPLGSAIFYSVAPALALLLAAGRSRGAIVAQSPLEGFGVVLLRGMLPGRLRPPLVIEVHGDWRTATTLYGKSWRRPASPFVDRMAQWALRRADRVRVIGDFTKRLVRESGYEGQVDQFVTFSDFAMFSEEPTVAPPAESHVVFVGSLDGPKGLDVLIEAWALVAKQVPAARLSIAGAGPMLREIRDRMRTLQLGDRIRLLGSIPRPGVRRLLDEGSCLVLPSRSEGLGRVILEAMARARPVVATRVGGIPEIVDDGRTGILVPPDDPKELASALMLILENADRCKTMGEEGYRDFLRLDPIREYEEGTARLAAWVGGIR